MSKFALMWFGINGWYTWSLHDTREAADQAKAVRVAEDGDRYYEVVEVRA
jgi:hypothetical protein